MSLIYDKQTYPSLQEYVKIGVQEAEKNKERLQFAHQIDGAILKTLDSLPVKTAVNKIVEVGTNNYKSNYKVKIGDVVYVTSDRAEVMTEPNENTQKVATLVKGKELKIISIW